MSVRGVPFLSQMRVSHQAYSRPGQSYFCCPCWSRPKADGECVVDELSRAPCLRTGRTALGVHASRLSDLPRVEVRFTTFPSRRLPGQPSRLAEVGLKLLASWAARQSDTNQLVCYDTAKIPRLTPHASA